MHSRRIDVDIENVEVSVSGATAIVTFIRRYQLTTVDGQRPLTNSRTTMNARRAGNEWHDRARPLRGSSMNRWCFAAGPLRVGQRGRGSLRDGRAAGRAVGFARAAAGSPADAVDAVRGHLRTARAGAEQRRRAARRQQPRGALQQRVPVGVPPDERGADQPAGDGAAALARVGVHVPLRRRRPARSSDRRGASARSWPSAARPSAAARSRSATRISSSPTTTWTACR